MWKWLDSAQLESDGKNCNNLKKDLKYKKKKCGHIHVNKPLFHMS